MLLSLQDIRNIYFQRGIIADFEPIMSTQSYQSLNFSHYWFSDHDVLFQSILKFLKDRLYQGWYCSLLVLFDNSNCNIYGKLCTREKKVCSSHACSSTYINKYRA